MFGLDQKTRLGIGNLRIGTKIGGIAEAEKLREIARQGYAFSPVRDSVDKGISFTPKIEVVSS
jgi:hypothetical protein